LCCAAIQDVPINDTQRETVGDAVLPTPVSTNQAPDYSLYGAQNLHGNGEFPRPAIIAVDFAFAGHVRQVQAILLSAAYPSSALALSARRPPCRHFIIWHVQPLRGDFPCDQSCVLAPDLTMASAISNSSTGTKLSPAWSFASASAFGQELWLWYCPDNLLRRTHTFGQLTPRGVSVSVTRAGLPPAKRQQMLATLGHRPTNALVNVPASRVGAFTEPSRLFAQA